MIIEKPYDQLRAVKNIMRDMAKNLADMEIIISNMQDNITCNLEGQAASLEYELKKRDRSEKLENILLDKEK